MRLPYSHPQGLNLLGGVGQNRGPAHKEMLAPLALTKSEAVAVDR